LRDLDEETRNRFLASLSPAERAYVESAFPLWAHGFQLPPDVAANGEPWTTWLILGGRGAGKTRAGAEWVRAMAMGYAGYTEKPVKRIALVGETAQDVREVMIEGFSGLLRVHRPHERPEWQSSRRRLVWPSGAIAEAFSAEDPDQLRGPQFEAAWCDELGKWRRAEAAFDMLQFGLRLGANPRQVITTTLRPTKLIKRLVQDPRAAVFVAPTRRNACNLAPTFMERVVARYGGTRLGRQELEAEIIEARDDGLFSRTRIEAARVDAAPGLKRIVVAVDPPASSREGSDACGIIAAGLGEDSRVYVLVDDSKAGLGPLAWARRAISLYHRLEADRIVVEVNQGGDMVRTVIAEVDMSVPISEVRATRGKYVRAEPVAALYEQGRVAHVGAFPALEDEMADFGPDGLSSGRSPDRLDALVWAVTALVLSPTGDPRVRAF
jgi:phage terminase large subunit-like protein